MAIIKPRSVAVLVVTAFFLLSFMWHRKRVQVSLLHTFCNCTGPLQENVTFPEVPSELQVKINDIFNRIQKLIPNVTLSNLNIATNGKKSKAFIVNSREKYCVGEDLVVQLDMYDALGNRKTYGGDFIWTRIFSPELHAAISGRVEDFYNGTYHVHFPLHWQGKVKFSAMLFHPSEGISALWRSRHASLGVIGFNGRFVHLKEQAITTCGFKLQTNEEVCEYLDPDDEEAFYCIKPKNLPCESLHDMMAIDLHSSYLSNEEKQLFQRSNIGVEIPANFEFVDVVDCNKVSSAKPNCQTGMNSPFPSGYFYNGVWNPVYCNMSNYNNAESLTKCLQGKKLFLIGDSTLRQFIMHFTEGIQMTTVRLWNALPGIVVMAVSVHAFKSGLDDLLDKNNIQGYCDTKIYIVKYFGYHGRQWQSWEETLLAINFEKDIYVSYKRHGFPLESFMFYYFKEDKYTSRQIDQQGGGKDTIFVITMGQHFRQFPLQLYIRRAINIRKAIERLFIRSPETKVIIKTENTREINAPVERIGDFHGYTQYLALREVFQGINVGFVDAWDMTVSSATATVHPPGNTFQGIMSLTFTFACS